MVAWVVNDRLHPRRTPPSSFLLPPSCFPWPHSHFGTHPTLVPQKIAPFFSCAYVEPILQPLCFQIHACNGGVLPSSMLRPSNVSACLQSIPFLFNSFWTLLHNGRSSTLLQSIRYAHFSSRRGVYESDCKRVDERPLCRSVQKELKRKGID